MKTHPRSPLSTCLAVVVLVCLMPSLLHAADRFWIRTSGTAPFNTTANWSTTSGGAGGASLPGSADTANFDLAGTYTVDFNGLSPSITNLDIEAGTVTFDLAGQTLLFSGVGRIGIPGGTAARLTLFDGTLDVDTAGDNIEIGTTDVDGFLTVSTHATIGAGGSNPDILIGNSGDGTFTVNNGGHVNSTSGQFGLASALSTGTATVSGLGSQWINSGAFVIGSSGTGTLTVQSGATISGTGSQIGSGGGSIGNATITGAGSTWTEAGSFTVGNFGIAALTISSGGQVSVGTSAFIAGQGNSFGTVNVSGASSQWIVGADLSVGNFGQGTLALASGGQVNCAALIIGNLNSSETEGTVSITGAGSALRATGAVDVGNDDLGFLTVANGGLLVTGAGVDIGNGVSGVGEVTVSGANALWSNTGTLNVAASGKGTLNVANGGAINNTGTLSINDPAGAAVGTFNFDGGTITTSNFTRAAGGVFNWTDGTLTLVNGIFNNASANLTINGGQAGDLPTLHLSGNSTGTGFGATTLTVGATRAGALQLSGFSTLSVLNTFVASADGGSGTVTVSGNSASLTSAGSLAVGGTDFNPGGTGTLNINAGASVAANDVQIWGGGTVNLDGGTLQTFTFTSDAGAFNFNSGTVHFTGSYSGGFVPEYDALLGFEHRLTAGKNIIYDGNFSFFNMNLIIDGGTFSQGGALTVNNNSILDMRSGTLTANTLAGTANGQVVLEGGILTLLTTFSNSGDLRLAATTDFSLISGTTLANTGLIHGHGQVGMSLANNSAGLVRTIANERMLFAGASSNNGTARLEVSAGGNLQFQSSLVNNSTIEVVGGTFRVQAATTNAASTGRITGRDAFMRFDGGLVNNGSLAFSFGTSDIFGDVTNTAVTGRIVVSGNSDATFYDDLVNNGAVQVSASSTAVYFGAVSGPGSFPGGGTNFFEGDLAPGASPALITFGGSVFFGAFNQLTMEIGGNARGAEYDALNIAGSLTLDGTMKIALINGFIPTVGQDFDLLDPATITGSFSSVTLPPLPAGRFWSTDLLATTGVLSVVGAPTLNYANNGTSLGFSWSGTFKLQAQTNSLNVGISTNWGDYPGGGSSPVSVPMDVLRGSVFFRLSSP